MNLSIASLSPRRAAVVVGIAFIASIVIVTLVDDFILANFVVPGDTAALARDIDAGSGRFRLAVVGYLLVLALDSVIGLALYVVLRAANKNLASLTAALRLLYAFTLVIGLILLVLQTIDVYGYASVKNFGYLFFGLHILVLGYSVFRSEYIPKILGIFLMFASFTYIVFFVDVHLPKIWTVTILLTMALSELSLSIWLIVKRNSLVEADKHNSEF